MLVVSAVCFGLMHAVPGGPEGVMAENPRISPEDLRRIRENFGLDRPVAVQYAKWLERVVLHGDFGISYTTGEPVSEMIMERLPATLELMGSAFVLSILVGIGIGVLSALKRHTSIESLITLGSLVVISIPVFWLGLVSIMLFSVRWGLFPSGGISTLGEPFSLADHARHLVLPTIVLSSVFAAAWSRYTKEALAGVLDESFVAVARAKGLRTEIVVLRHALSNALAPVTTVVAMSVPVLFTGSVIIETIFAWPGMGRLFYEGLVRQDYTRIMGVVVVSSFLVAFFNLMADCLYGVFDPRTRRAG
jgi:peptide/nickel transport system permease protein